MARSQHQIERRRAKIAQRLRSDPTSTERTSCRHCAAGKSANDGGAAHSITEGDDLAAVIERRSFSAPTPPVTTSSSSLRRMTIRATVCSYRTL
ncbi:MAG TPA: hypothetical protein VLJ38_13670, partial [Polyangiaceae bacterium]|nr:hypothetical protein [Polyangiaceae bacterium]